MRAYCNGTEELQRLLDFECDLIYECKVCRSLYRSLSNFIQHKKFHCNERYQDMEKTVNGEMSEKYTHINGIDPKGQLLATRKTTKKEVYELLQNVGNLSVKPLPNHFFTKDLKETEAALLNFFRQEGTAESEERVATIDADGMIVDNNNDERVSSLSSQSAQNGDRDATSSEAENQPPHSTHSTDIKTPSSSPSSISGNRGIARPGYRAMYQCPQCKKDFSTMFNVYRHSRRVHHMTQEQVRKIRKKITKNMVRLNDGHLLNSQKEIPHNGFSADESPALNGPQPRVVLTKTSCPDGVDFPTPPSSVGSSQKTNATSSNASEDQSEGHHVPKKKLKTGSSLSWLKKGPSVPVVNGPLTRTARALYGSPSKVIQWDPRRGVDRNRSICSGGSTGERESHNPHSDDESVFSSDDLPENETEPSVSVKKGRRDSQFSVGSVDSVPRSRRRSRSDERTSSISSSLSSLEDAPALDSDDNDRQQKKFVHSSSTCEAHHGDGRGQGEQCLVNVPAVDVDALDNRQLDEPSAVKRPQSITDEMLSGNVMEVIFGSSTGARYSINYGAPDTDESS
ncbi:ZnF_C2H2 [Nesidiocoris tenuis]|nr:ZnF_C2H2 [Nesidiocoris tenuis]